VLQGKPKYSEETCRYPPQIPHDLARDRNRTAAMESRRLTTWIRLVNAFHLHKTVYTGYKRVYIPKGKFVQWHILRLRAVSHTPNPQDEYSSTVALDCFPDTLAAPYVSGHQPGIRENILRGMKNRKNKYLEIHVLF
jgi:hypothetical protein